MVPRDLAGEIRAVSEGQFLLDMLSHAACGVMEG